MSSESPPKTILITGAAGFIASCHKSFKFVKADIASSDLINYLLDAEEIDTIMHFAAETRVDNSFGNSTDEVYGESDLETDIGNPEASQLLPTNPYSATKAGAEMLVMAYHRSYGLPIITTRGNNVYGPNQFPEKLIPKFILLAMRGDSLPIHGDGSNVRSYLYCGDVAEAFDVVLHKGAIGHVYNIGTKKERSVLDVATHISKLFGINVQKTIRFVNDRPFNDKRYFLDDQKLKKLGWEQRTPWEVGLKMTIAWYRENPNWWGNVGPALHSHPRIPTTVPSQNEEEFLMQHKIVSSNNELKFLIYGRTGWIGGLLGKLCMDKGIAYAYGRGKLQDRKMLLNDIRALQPTHVFNAAGLTGRPNVDWCETHKVETISTNVVGTLNLADVCSQEGIYLINFATGCIFEYDKDQPQVEEMLREYDNVCTLRLRMPISSDLSNSRNFITKITRYNKVVNIPNSMSVLDELLPISIEMAERKCKGVWNFTNPGVVSHNEILELYREYIDPNFKWANFDLEEQAKVILAPRSNNELDVSKLKKEFPELLSIKDSIIKNVFEPNKRSK
ncbi:trifunctional UDP-glucose 4,6-dehydratase/UDP-4-keto-6-deoxy-D-glucose 3,5-epimerase/UDP-4-keto-L-rhamnose-reductase RHM1-like protein [Tanacetum coccineum]